MESLVLTIGKRDNISVVSVKGKIWSVSAHLFEKRMKALIDEGETKVIVALEDLEYISSAGLLSFIAIDTMLKARKGELALTGLKDFAEKVFELSQLLSWFNIFGSVDEALTVMKPASNRLPPLIASLSQGKIIKPITDQKSGNKK